MPEVKQLEMRAGSTRFSTADRDRQRFRRPPCRLGLPLGRHDRTQPQPLGPPPAGSDGGFETALLRLMPSFVPCADHINRAVPTGRPLEVDLASFGPGVTFGFELGLEFRFGLEFGFDLEFGFGDGEIDHEAESVGKLPCR